MVANFPGTGDKAVVEEQSPPTGPGASLSALGDPLDGPRLSYSPQHLRQSSTQRGYNLTECPQARLAGSPLQVGDVDLMDAGLLGKVDLPPIPGAAQLSDPLTGRRTVVLCCASMFGLGDALC